MWTLETLIKNALQEDLGSGDITTRAVVPENAWCEARLVAKQEGVLSGIEVFRSTFLVLDSQMRDWSSCLDGERFEAGDLLASFVAPTRSVLSAERTALNFVQHLSGVATLTAAYVERVADLHCRIVDTRKTTPLLRRLEKEAVVHGGGVNHRFNLASGILIKENHVAAAGGITAALERARKAAPHTMRVEIEVRNLEEFEEAVKAGAEIILLDNMSLDAMREAVRRVEGRPILLEASGNVTLDRVRAVAETGVHFISIGALTHSAPAIDMSLLIRHV